MTARWTPRFDTGWSDGVVPAAPMAFKIFKSKETAAAWGVAAVAMAAWTYYDHLKTSSTETSVVDRIEWNRRIKESEQRGKDAAR